MSTPPCVLRNCRAVPSVAFGRLAPVLARGCVVAMVVAASAGRAQADITSATWSNNTLFHYRVQHMPDIDQKRDALPCGGVIHCVPTCASNMVMYAANHGFPTVEPGPAYWEGDTNYDLATTVVGFMGLVMDTSCDSGGTNGTNANAGLLSWLAGEPGLVVNDHLSLGAFSPTHGSIGKSLCAGRVGSISYGRYDVVGNFKGIPLVDRDGGHCTTAVKVRRNGASRDLWVRDPASDEGDDTTQSAFFNDIWTVTDLTVIVMPNIDMKTMTAINYTPGDTVIRLIDGHRTLTPAQGYSWNSSLGAVVMLGPANFLNPGLPPQTFPSPTGTPVLQLAWHDATGELLLVCAGANGNTLQSLDPAARSAQPIPLPAPPELVATGPGDEVYFHSQGRCFVKSYSVSGDTDGGVSPPFTLPHAAHAMVVDDARNDLVMVSRTDRRLMRTPRSLDGSVSVHMIPTVVPMGTRVQIAINPRESNAVYLWSDASNQIWKLLVGTGGVTAAPLSLPAAPLPRSLDFDDRGHMLVSNNGVLVEFEPVPTFGPGAWQVVQDSLFAGLPADRNFRMTRSRSNFKPGVHDTPGWTTNIDPAELPENPQVGDCAGDIAPLLNTDDIVDVNDLLAIISVWGPCANTVNCPADIAPVGAGNDVVNVDDLLAVINAWGACETEP